MPIEIKELHIKAVIDNSSQDNAAANTTNSDTGLAPDKLIEICVEKVLEILKEKAER